MKWGNWRGEAVEKEAYVFGVKRVKILRRDMDGWGEERDRKGTHKSVTRFIG